MGKHFLMNSGTQYFRNVGNLSLPFFEFWKFRIPGFLIIKNDEFLKMMKSRRRGISWHPFCRRNVLKSLDMNFISIKKHETLFSKNEPTFLFLGEVIPITNQLILTLASVRMSNCCIRAARPLIFFRALAAHISL